MEMDDPPPQRPPQDASACKMTTSEEEEEEDGEKNSGIDVTSVTTPGGWRTKESSEGKSGESRRRRGSRCCCFGGMDQVIDKLKEKVVFPFCCTQAVRQQHGIKPVSGILLKGPPGCGKTRLAHAIANECNLPLFKISATELVSSLSGELEKNIRNFFSEAHRSSPSVVFIDEIDAIASDRENAQREQERRIVTQLMCCMDEHNWPDPSHPVLVIGATNRPHGIVPALRRPARFDCEIELGVLNLEARVEILKVLTRNCKLHCSVDQLELARLTPGFVAANLYGLVKEAAACALSRVLHARLSDPSGTSDCERLGMTPWNTPLTSEETEKLVITMSDFLKATKEVQPSLTREGFTPIPDVKLDDVSGLNLIKKTLKRHIVNRIKYPEDSKKYGVNSQIGILLYGPPGCGKTLIAKAVANESGANFIHIQGPQLLSKYVGETEKRIRELFDRARTASPCVIFFDEVDALMKKRGTEGGSDGSERILAQLLTELDSVQNREGVFMVGATNR